MSENWMDKEAYLRGFVDGAIYFHFDEPPKHTNRHSITTGGRKSYRLIGEQSYEDKHE